MRLALLLKLQVSYALAGLAYNVVSAIRVHAGLPQLSTTTPALGGAMMVIYAAFLISGWGRFHRGWLYRGLMGLSVVVFAYGGIWQHVATYLESGLAGYHGPVAWILAVGINVYGLVLNTVAAAGWYRRGLLRDQSAASC